MNRSHLHRTARRPWIAGSIGAFLLVGVVTAARADVMLAFKLQEGSSNTHHEEVIDQILTLNGMEIVTKAKTVATMRSEISAPGKDGSRRIKETFLTMTANLDLPGGLKLVYDSAKPDEAKVDNPALQPALDAFKAFKGLTYSVTLNKDLKVQSVEGTEAFPPALSAAGGLTKESIKRETDQHWSLLPGKSVKKGERWNRTENKDLGGGQNLIYDVFYEYQGTVEKGGKSFEKLGVFVNTARLEIDPNAQLPAKVKQSDLKIESSSGEILLDRESGNVVERTTRTRIVGPLTLDVMGMEIAGKLDLTLDQTTVTK